MKKKKLAAGLLCLTLAISAFGAGAMFAGVPSMPGSAVEAYAETVTGKQAAASASAFDSNGWFTQDAYNAMADKTNTVSTDPNVAYLAYLKPEVIGGYSMLASFANGKIINNKQLSVADEISFEIGIVEGTGHGNRFIHFMDSASIGEYLGVKETNTKFGIMFDCDGAKAEIYVNGEKQTLTGGVNVKTLEKTKKAIWEKMPVVHFVSVKFGSDTEKTKVYIDNELVAELDIKQSDFESGKVQLVSDFWGGGGDPWVFFSAFDPFTVIKAPVAQNPIIANGFDKDIVVELTKPVTEISVENAADTKVTLEKDIDYTVSGNTVTIKKEFIAGKPINYFKADTQLIFETADSRTASLALNILYYDPPVYTQSGGSAVVAEALTKDLTFEVGYTHEEAYTMKVNGAALAAENFTATWANNKITVALKKEYINALTQGAYTFELTTLAGKVEYSVYRKTAANEWVLVDAEKPVVEEKVEKNANGSTKITLSTLGRAYYSEKIDVTKPIYFEMDIETAKTGAADWLAVSLLNNETLLSSFNEANGKDRFTFLYGHNKGEFQSPSILPNALFKPEYINKNGPQLFKLVIAEANEDGTTKAGQMTALYFNGYKIFETDKQNQAAFKNGAYLGFFSSLAQFTFTTRTDVTSPVANTYGLEYTLGTDENLSVPMYNATSVSAVKYGDTVLAAKDYTFAEGTLTIKGSFLKTIAYDDMMTFVVTADGVEVKINVKALSEVDPEKSFVAYTGADGAKFDKKFAGKTVEKVLDTKTSAALTQEQYSFSADGTLTIAKAYFTTTGTYSFAVVTDDGLYFAVAVNYEYDANGLANRMEANNGSWADNTLTVSGESDYLFKDFVDLTQEGGVSYTLDISKINGYYKSGLDGSKNAYIALSFYDMFSGNTIMLKLYANDTEESGAQMAYVELLIRDKNNKPVYMGNTAIEDEKNYFDESIMTKNVLTFSVENNALCVELNGDYSMYLDLGDTVLTTLQLSVASTADIEGVKNEFAFSTKAEAPVEPEKPGTSENSSGSEKTESGASKGCGSTVASSAILAAGTLLASAAVVCKKKKSDK